MYHEQALEPVSIYASQVGVEVRIDNRLRVLDSNADPSVG